MIRQARALAAGFHGQGLGRAGANFPVEIPRVKVHARNVTLPLEGLSELEVSPREPTKLRALASGYLIYSCLRSPAP